MDSNISTSVFGIVGCLVMLSLFMVFKRHIGKRNSSEITGKVKPVRIIILVFVLLMVLDLGKDWFIHLFLGGNPK